MLEPNTNLDKEIALRYDNQQLLIKYLRHRYTKSHKFENYILITSPRAETMMYVYKSLGGSDDDINKTWSIYNATDAFNELSIGNDNAFLIWKRPLTTDDSMSILFSYAVIFYNDYEYLLSLFSEQNITDINKLYVLNDNGGFGRFTQSIEELPTNPIKPILNGDLLSEVMSDISHFFKNEHIYKANNLPYKRGLLLYGPPGNGKTTLIKYLLANTPNVYKFIVSPDVFTDYTGLITFLRTKFNEYPLLIIAEDIDTISDYTLTGLLNFLDGELSLERMYFIGTANKVSMMKASIKDRPGRFDWVSCIDNPDTRSRKKLLKTFFPTLDDDHIDEYAKLTDGLSAAYFKEIYIYSTLNNCELKKAIKDVKKRIKQMDVYREGNEYMG